MPKQKYIPYSRQSINAADIAAITKALKADLITQGPLVNKFEEAFAKYCGARYAIAVSSGTAALHLAALAAGFKPKSEVITTPLTFVATSNSILYTGAKPRFADIDRHSLGLDPENAIGLINKKTVGILPVHYSGQPCNLEPYQALRQAGLIVIEDACHALGSESFLDGRMRRIGHCLDSDMAVFSFHAVKHITTGEGGMITTRSKDLYQKLLLLRSHGITKDSKKFNRKEGANEPWFYEMTALGFNYRMSDIQSAMGLSQLKKMNQFLKRRIEIAQLYQKHLDALDFIHLPESEPHTKSSYHLYVLRIDFARLKKTRPRVMRELGLRGIGTQVHYIPVTQQPYYRKHLGTETIKLPICDAFYQEALSIPLHPSMTNSDVRRVIASIKAVCG